MIHSESCYLMTSLLLFNHFFERDKQSKILFANGTSCISGDPTREYKEEFNCRGNQSLPYADTDITLNGRTDKMLIFSSKMSSFAFCFPSDFSHIKKLTLL